MTDQPLSPDHQAALKAAHDPEPTLSPQQRRWLKAQSVALFGFPPEDATPQCWDTGHNWSDT